MHTASGSFHRSRVHLSSYAQVLAVYAQVLAVYAQVLAVHARHFHPAASRPRA